MLVILVSIGIVRYRILFLIQLISMSVVSVLLLILCESAFYYYSRNKITGLYRALKCIGWWNNKSDNAESMANYFINQIIYSPLKLDNKNIPISDNEPNISQPWVRRLSNVISFASLLILFYISYAVCDNVTHSLVIHNIYIDNIVAGSAELLSAIMALIVIKRIERNYLIKVTCITSLIVASLLLCVQFVYRDMERVNWIFEVTFTIVMKTIFWVTIIVTYVYGVELFTTKTRGVVFEDLRFYRVLRSRFLGG